MSRVNLFVGRKSRWEVAGLGHGQNVAVKEQSDNRVAIAMQTTYILLDLLGGNLGRAAKLASRYLCLCLDLCPFLDLYLFLCLSDHTHILYPAANLYLVSPLYLPYHDPGDAHPDQYLDPSSSDCPRSPIHYPCCQIFHFDRPCHTFRTGDYYTCRVYSIYQSLIADRSLRATVIFSDVIVMECMYESVSWEGNKNWIENGGKAQVSVIGNGYENVSDSTKD